jgi:hypothetical protein
VTDLIYGTLIQCLLIDLIKFHVSSAVDWVMMQSCFGEHFMLVLEKLEAHGILQYYAIVQMIGTKREAEMFFYRLELSGNKKRMTWEATPQSLHENLALRLLNSDCLLFDGPTAGNFAQHGNLPINVTISSVARLKAQAPFSDPHARFCARSGRGGSCTLQKQNYYNLCPYPKRSLI